MIPLGLEGWAEYAEGRGREGESGGEIYSQKTDFAYGEQS